MLSVILKYWDTNINIYDSPSLNFFDINETSLFRCRGLFMIVKVTS
jgi:hypothetical protein